MNKLPILTDDEFYGTLLNALFVAREKYQSNIRELSELPERDTTTVRVMTEQVKSQVQKVTALMERLEEETTDA